MARSPRFRDRSGHWLCCQSGGSTLAHELHARLCATSAPTLDLWTRICALLGLLRGRALLPRNVLSGKNSEAVDLSLSPLQIPSAIVNQQNTLSSLRGIGSEAAKWCHPPSLRGVIHANSLEFNLPDACNRWLRCGRRTKPSSREHHLRRDSIHRRGTQSLLSSM